MTTILFPSEPFQPRRLDAAFEEERDAAEQAGFAWALVDHTRVAAGEAQAAVAATRAEPGDAVYRGWMLRAEAYAAMHGALAARGVRLGTTPEAYATCHHLPESYAHLEGDTPKTVWQALDEAPSREALAALMAPFGCGAIVVKDFVKSQKHYWTEACFAPDASDLDHVSAVVERFLELQGEDLVGGLVVREHVPLRILGHHPKSGMPLAAEFRIFWLDGEAVLTHRYWGDLVDLEVALPLDDRRPLVAQIPSRFFTMDVALLDDGSWTIIELGDAQVSGLPSVELAPGFYAAMKRVLTNAR